jgi:hypothetical protein
LQKVTYILCVLFFLNGCSAVKKKSISENEINRVPENNLLEGIKKQNITNRSFFIQKAEVVILSEDYEQKLQATIKFSYPDKYLISLKSRTGVEVARIFITKDTILVNDRFNKKLYFGNPDNLKKKYGISNELLPVIFGDFIYEKDSLIDNIVCTDNKIDINCKLNKIRMNYIIDCKKKKIVSASQEINVETGYTDIRYENFIETGYGFIPAQIRVDFNNYAVTVKIERIEYPWEGTIEFIPGNKYDLIKL